MSIFPTSVLTADVQRMLHAQFSIVDMTTAEREALAMVAQLFVRKNAEEQRLGGMLAALVPGVQAAAVSYCHAENAFVTQPFTSLAGNTYCSSLRVSDSVVIKTDIGQGWMHTFLNGISIFSADGKKTLLARRFFHAYIYHEEWVVAHSVDMVAQTIFRQLPEHERAANVQAAETLAHRCITEVYNTDQVGVLRKANAYKFEIIFCFFGILF